MQFGESAILRDPELSNVNRNPIYEGIDRTLILLAAWNVAVSAERWASARNYSADFEFVLVHGANTAVEAAAFGAEDCGIRPDLYGANEKEREDKALGAAQMLLTVTELSAKACTMIDVKWTASEGVYEKSAASFERQSAKFGEGRLAREILFVLCRLQEERCEYLHEKGSDSARRHAWADLQLTLKRLSKYTQDKEALTWTKRIVTARLKLGQFKHAEPVVSAQFSPEGNRIVTASWDNNARVWDAQTGQLLTEPMRHDAKVGSAQFSPDGHWIVTASSDKTARVWDAQTGQPLTEPMRHDADVSAAEFSPDGRRIVTVSYVKPARVWDAQTGQPLTHLIEHDAKVSAAQFSPDGKWIVTASWYNSTARIWDAQTGQPLTEPMKHDAPVESAQFSPDGHRIVTASDDKTARVWDAQTGQPLTTPMKHDDKVWSAQFSPDGNRIVTASWDKTARVWDAQTGQPLAEPMKHDAALQSAQFSPDGHRIVTASDDKTARVWDAQTGQPLTTPMKHDGSVHSAQFSPDGKRIVTASDDAAWVWDAQTGQPLTHLIEHDGDVSAAQFSGDGKRIVTSSADKTARVWDISPTEKHAPEWLPRLAEAIAGEHLNERGVFEPLSQDPAEVLREIKQQLSNEPGGDDWITWGRWLLADRSTRRISPFSKITLTENNRKSNQSKHGPIIACRSRAARSQAMRSS
jgi:WD40 repeat protein